MSNKYAEISRVKIRTLNKNGKTILDDVYFTSPFKVAPPFYKSDDFIKVIIMSSSAGTLEGDVAGNLLVKINELEEVVNNLDLVASKVTMSDGNTVEDAITANKTSILNLQSELGTNKSTLQNNINAIREVL